MDEQVIATAEWAAQNRISYFSGMFDLIFLKSPKERRDFLLEQHRTLNAGAAQLNRHYEKLSEPSRKEFCVRIGGAGRSLAVASAELREEQLPERTAYEALWNLGHVYAELEVIKLRMRQEDVHWYSSN